MADESSKVKLLIDCDPGTDDFLALLIALACHIRVEVIGITVTFGNSTLEYTSRNVLRALKLCDRLDVPVYKGCSRATTLSPPCFDNFHGVDGLGDVVIEDVDPVDMQLIQKEHASIALCRLADKYAGEITLVALGPLTNVATALMLDHNLGRKLKDFVFVGGNYQSYGNVTSQAEFNIYSDVEAARAVFTGLNRVITMIPLETCCQSPLSLEWFNKATSLSTKVGPVIRKIYQHALPKLLNAETSTPEFQTFDQIGMAVAINPQVVKEMKEVYASVELNGIYTRGQVAIDWNKKNPPNVKLVTKINLPVYEKLLRAAFCVV